MVLSARIPEDPEQVAARQSASLGGLAVTLALVVAGLFLVQTLRTEAARQDMCLAGRVNCLALNERGAP